jgi:hypothetical protein
VCGPSLSLWTSPQCEISSERDIYIFIKCPERHLEMSERHRGYRGHLRAAGGGRGGGKETREREGVCICMRAMHAAKWGEGGREGESLPALVLIVCRAPC